MKSVSLDSPDLHPGMGNHHYSHNHPEVSYLAPVAAGAASRGHHPAGMGMAGGAERSAVLGYVGPRTPAAHLGGSYCTLPSEVTADSALAQLSSSPADQFQSHHGRRLANILMNRAASNSALVVNSGTGLLGGGAGVTGPVNLGVARTSRIIAPPGSVAMAASAPVSHNQCKSDLGQVFLAGLAHLGGGGGNFTNANLSSSSPPAIHRTCRHQQRRRQGFMAFPDQFHWTNLSTQSDGNDLGSSSNYIVTHVIWMANFNSNRWEATEVFIWNRLCNGKD